MVRVKLEKETEKESASEDVGHTQSNSQPSLPKEPSEVKQMQKGNWVVQTQYYEDLVGHALQKLLNKINTKEFSDVIANQPVHCERNAEGLLAWSGYITYKIDFEGQKKAQENVAEELQAEQFRQSDRYRKAMESIQAKSTVPPVPTEKPRPEVKVDL
jgi:hypothetical protein